MRTRLPVLLALGISSLFVGTEKSGETAERVPVKTESVGIGEPTRLEIYPRRFRLGAKRRSVQLVVTGHYADGTTRDLTRDCRWKIADESVVEVTGGVARPLADGLTEVRAVGGDREAVALIEVSGQSQADPVSFHFETLAALSKQGCNAGACHGSPSGKGGFRLSLRAFDPSLDQLTLIREIYNRRVDLLQPESSLILLKPLGRVPHGGGTRLRESDVAYDLLRDWIAEGCVIDKPDAPSLQGIEIYPPSGRELRFPVRSQQITVFAKFSDGTVRDITELAVFTSSDETVATIDAHGVVVGHDRGEIAVMVRYLDQIETVDVTFIRDVEGFAWKAPEPSSHEASRYIDELVFKKLKKLQYLPSEIGTDDEFLRRSYLDVIGTLPSLAAVKRFHDDERPDKRSRLVDELLERPGYAAFWATKWGDVLRLTRKTVTPDGAHKYYTWLVQSFARNQPYDEFARELLTASGSTYSNPAANYYRTSTDAADAAESTAQVFLGFRLACAKCHNHPFERWTQDNYYGMTAFFNRVKRKPGSRKDEIVVWVERRGEVTQPRTKKTMPPWLPLIGDATVSGDDDRREALAEWMTRTENPFFATVEVNRIWYHLMGKGIVDPVDDFRDSNPPSNAELLAALASDFRESGFDRKHILRTILNSRTYQLSSTKNDFNRDDTRFFSHAYPRLLGAEQLLDGICHVTGVGQRFGELPPGTPATQLPSPDPKIEFLKVFGQPERQTVCQCERQTETNLSKALQMFNGSLIHGKLRDGNNRIRRAIREKKTDDDIVTELYLAAFCRQPRAEELDAAKRYLEKKDKREEALEDVCWALLNSNEFLFQH
jgi:hypothetical protein